MVFNENNVQKIFLQVIYAVRYRHFILYFAYDSVPRARPFPYKQP